MKLQRQFCDGNTDANTDDRDDYKCPFLYLFFHKELMGHIMRKPVFVICEQQMRRSAWASTQSDQRLCCSLPGYNEILELKAM